MLLSHTLSDLLASLAVVLENLSPPARMNSTMSHGLG